jgi:hypothetical protein
MNLVIKRYLYSKGPVERPDLLTAVMDEGNCRLAVQAYFHFEHSKWLRDNEILNPNAYYNTGRCEVHGSHCTQFREKNQEPKCDTQSSI